MTMTPWNLTHGQWSKNLTMTTMTFWNMPHGRYWSKWLFCGQTSWLDQRFTILTIENLYFSMAMVEMGIFVDKCRGKILG